MSTVLPNSTAVHPVRANWRPWLPWLALLLAVLLLFRETAASMVAIWIRSETFTHAFLVPAISVWLVWQRRAQLGSLPVRPVYWLLLPVAGVCLGWLAGELASVQSASQFALVSLVVLSVPAVLGWTVARAMAFPLLFLYFAVPWGEFMLPWLIERTADVTVMALRLTGIPVYREGQQFVIPSGTWSVVEACSGMRYLVASFMVGTLFAYLNYNSLWRRLGFVLVSLAVPLVANWLRAYLIVMLGHLSSNKLATGADHLVYGWLFFGVVMLVMFAIGARWSEPHVESSPPPPDDPSAPAAAPTRSARLWGMALAVLALCAAVHGVLWRMDHAGPDTEVVLGRLPAEIGSWRAEEVDHPTFSPSYKGANAEQVVRFSKDGREVGLWVGYYRQQNAQRKLVTSTNVLAESKDQRWSLVGAGRETIGLAGLALNWRTARLRDANPLAASEGSALAVRQIYWIGGRWMASDVRAKLWTAWNRVQGRGDDGAVLVLYTPALPGHEQALADLAQALLPELDRRFERVRAGQ